MILAARIAFGIATRLTATTSDFVKLGVARGKAASLGGRLTIRRRDAISRL